MKINKILSTIRGSQNKYSIIIFLPINLLKATDIVGQIISLFYSLNQNLIKTNTLFSHTNKYTITNLLIKTLTQRQLIAVILLTDIKQEQN